MKRVASKVLVGAATGAVVGALQAIIPEAEQATDKMAETQESLESKTPGE